MYGFHSFIQLLFISATRRNKTYIIILSFIITYTTTFTGTLFFCVDLNYCLVSLPFCLKEHPLKEGLLAMNSVFVVVFFLNLGMSLFLFHFFKPTLYRYNSHAVDFPGGTVVKNPPANAGNTGSSPGPGRSHMMQSN